MLDDLQQKENIEWDEEVRIIAEDESFNPYAEKAFNVKLLGILKLLRVSPVSPISVEDGMRDDLLAEKEKEESKKARRKVASEKDESDKARHSVGDSSAMKGIVFQTDEDHPIVEKPKVGDSPLNQATVKTPKADEVQAIVETPKTAEAKVSDEISMPIEVQADVETEKMVEVHNPLEVEAPGTEGASKDGFAGSDDILNQISFEV